MRTQSTIAQALLLGSIYFAFAFCAGTLLGTLRELLIAPLWGTLAATAVEVPIMLAFSWFAAARIYFRQDRFISLGGAAASGCFALLLLLVSEILLGRLALGMTLSQILTHWQSAAGAAGLGAQFLFASIPAVQRAIRERPL